MLEKDFTKSKFRISDQLNLVTVGIIGNTLQMKLVFVKESMIRAQLTEISFPFDAISDTSKGVVAELAQCVILKDEELQLIENTLNTEVNRAKLYIHERAE